MDVIKEKEYSSVSLAVKPEKPQWLDHHDIHNDAYNDATEVVLYWR